jgi:serine/threonine protein kinase
MDDTQDFVSQERANPENRFVGGRLIQEGSYGCAFTPPLPCKKGKRNKSRTKMVGKVMKKTEAEVELNIATLIEGIPGYSRYFVVQVEDNCTSKNFSRLREEYSSMCTIYAKKADNELIQLLSSFSGRSLEKTPITSSFDFVGIFRHMLEGIVLLHKQDICHCDIHEGNILISPNGTTRLIDFGAAFVGNAISEETVQDHNYRFSPYFDPQPPEMAIQNAIQSKVSTSFAIHQVIYQKKILQKASNILGLSLAKQKRDLEAFWFQQDMTWSGKSWVPFYKAYWKSWDAFSLGVLFFKLLLKCLYLPSFLNTVWRNDSKVITEVLKGLLQANPMYRMSVEEALERIKRIA